MPPGRPPGRQGGRQPSEFSSSAPSTSRSRVSSTSISADGRRVCTQLRKTSGVTKPRGSRSTNATPPSATDRFASWTPCGLMDSSSTAPSGTAQPPQDNDNDNNNNNNNNNDDDNAAAGQKRKRYQNSDDPMSSWVPLIPKFIEEILRRDGLGDGWGQPACTSCDKPYSSGACRLFRCCDCHDALECRDCLLVRHRYTPLHHIKEWNGDYWEDICLRDLGYTLYLGHPKSTCPGPGVPKDIVVIHTNGIHRVRVHYCSCRATSAASNIEQLLRFGWYPATVVDPHTCATFNALDLFRLLNVIASVNADAFYKTLLAMSDPCQLNGTPDKYKAFIRIERQYAFLLRWKRGGRAYRPAFPGDLAVLCWGCPREGVNLPLKWKEADESSKYLYMLIVAMDANFRLKNRFRANDRGYPSLGPGSAYFVEPTEYQNHIKKYVVEQDVSTCVAFAALLQKETKITTGLRTSGVAGVVCARHELVRALGLGDLQKGERYSNMDFVLFSSIRKTNLQRITLSYDIVCQYDKNLPARMTHLPNHLHLDKNIKLQFGIPTFHAAVHELSCRSVHSLSYQEGVGRTDGEGIERTWSILNDAAWSTKEMGEGSRHDHIDDKIDYHNFHKNIGLGELLARRLIIARDERDRQQANFRATSATLKPEFRKKWQAEIDHWEKTKTGKNPYMLGGEHKNPTEAQVRASLKKEEAEEAAAGKIPLHSTTAAAFLAQGMLIESLQQKNKCASASSSLSMDSEAKVHERRVSILAKLKSFRDLQRIYVPGAARAIAKAEEAQPPSATLSAESIKLWLPSDIPPAERRSSLAAGLAAAEARLREAQCADALKTVRRHLHSKHHLIAWRNANAVGQDTATRSRTLIDTVGDKVKAGATKYRRSREALVSLLGEEKTERYPPLLDGDLTGDVVVEDDALAQRRLALVKNKSKRKHVATGTTTLSWIWTAHLGPEDRQHALDESIRVSWAKSWLRVKHWNEEVCLLQEEMRRVLRSLNHQESLWKGYAVAIGDSGPSSQGRRAYALRQANLYGRIRDRFFIMWSSPFGKDRHAIVTPSLFESLDTAIPATTIV